MNKRLSDACQTDVRFHELSGDFGIARAYEIAKMNFISLQLRDSISAAQLGIRGSATSASPGADTYGGRYGLRKAAAVETSLREGLGRAGPMVLVPIHVVPRTMCAAKGDSAGAFESWLVSFAAASLAFSRRSRRARGVRASPGAHARARGSTDEELQAARTRWLG